MRLGKYELRSPVIKYVDIDLDEKIYNAIRASIGEKIAKDIEAELCGCVCNGEHCFDSGIREAVAIAKGQK